MTSSPQAGIFTEGNTHFYYLEYQLQPDAATQDIRRAVQSALAVKGGEPSETVVAFGKDAWDRLNPAWCPEGLRAFGGSFRSGWLFRSFNATGSSVLDSAQSPRREYAGGAGHPFVHANGGSPQTRLGRVSVPGFPRPDRIH